MKKIFFNLFLIFSALIMLTGFSLPVKIIHLQTEFQDRPLGLDIAQPRFSWQLQDSRRGAAQTAYRIWVSGDSLQLLNGNADSWDSQKIFSDSSVLINYQGKILQPMHRYFWQVEAWDQNGKSYGKSNIASFETGLMNPQNWRATWISGPLPKDAAGADIPNPLLRKSFSVNKKIISARVYATALGSYYLYINGKKIGQDILDPGWTDYRKTVIYQTYNVTNFLQNGKNAIGVLLGKGWYGSGLGSHEATYNFGRPPVRLLLQMKIDYADSTSQWIVSDNSWKTAPSPVIDATIYDGEIYDGTKEIAGWDKPDFNDNHWSAVSTPVTPDINIISEYAPPIQITQTLLPDSIYKVSNNKYVFDLGQNMVGWAKLKVHGKKGDTIRMRFAEVLLPDGNISTINLRKAKATDYYILKGSGEEIFEPHFTYHGFRYVEVSGIKYRPDKSTITGCVFHTNAPVSGNFFCSNKMVNKLWENITWGERGNLESIPTDCPQRDERLGWMGDAQTFWRTASYNRNLATFTHKWMRDVRDAQSPEGFYADVSPRVVDNADGAPAWADAGVIVPWTAFHQYADVRIIRENWDAMNKYLQAIYKYNPDFIWQNQLHNNFGDWLPAGQTTPNSTTPGNLIATCYWAYDALLMKNMAQAIGDDAAAQQYQILHDNIKKAFQKKFVHANDTIGNNSQTSNVLAIQSQLLDSAQTTIAVQHIVNDIQKHNTHLATGFLGTAYIMEVLSAHHQNNVAYKLLLTDTYPSWLYMVKEGATTMWERWNGNTGDPAMNSYNHYSLGSVGEWLYRFVAGIDTKGAGFKNIIIHPHPGAGLTFAKATYKSNYGIISSSWQQYNNKFDLEIILPPNTNGEIYLPCTNVARITESGQALSQNKFIKEADIKNGNTVLNLPAGTYYFSCEE